LVYPSKVNKKFDMKSLEVEDFAAHNAHEGDNGGLPREAAIARRYGLNEVRLNLLESNPTKFFGDQEICSYLAFMAKNIEKKIVIIDSTIISLRGPIINPTNVTFGDLNNFRILILPIFSPGHYIFSRSLIIYDKLISQGFYLDSLQRSPSRLLLKYRDTYCDEGTAFNEHDATEWIGDRIKYILSIFLNMDQDKIIINELIAARDFYKQLDGHNCGPIICLYAESYLLFEKFKKDIDINKERTRILSNLRNILITDNSIYQPLDSNGILISIPSKDALYQRQNKAKNTEAKKIYVICVCQTKLLRIGKLILRADRIYVICVHQTMLLRTGK
jgi:hypothetical protein